MMLITKELALAVVTSHASRYLGVEYCDHCNKQAKFAWEIKHDSTCIVVRAKLLLKYEWRIEA